MLNIKQVGIKYHFLVFGMTQPGIEPQFTGPLGEHSTQINFFKEMNRFEWKLQFTYASNLRLK